MKDKIWRILGLMSGTSLDGLDVALCEFISREGGRHITYKILQAETFSYSKEEKTMLSLMHATAQELAFADHAFGRFCGEKVKDFMERNHLTADFVASHGHTVFHQPERGFTTQIGNGASLSAFCNLPVVCDFRSLDVALGGQGAPLVPIGDLLLFKEFDYCLNLGGIANISIKDDISIKAFDVCPANMALNLLANEKLLEYDENGSLARKGKVNASLLKELNGLPFYKQPAPKSIGKEWVDSIFMPLITQNADTCENKLATLVKHIVEMVAQCTVSHPSRETRLLVTGGGALNGFLVESLQIELGDSCRVVVPDAKLVGFKEALIFAFLGMLRISNRPNALRSVTGAQYDSVGGALYGDFSNLLNGD